MADLKDLSFVELGDVISDAITDIESLRQQLIDARSEISRLVDENAIKNQTVYALREQLESQRKEIVARKERKEKVDSSGLLTEMILVDKDEKIGKQAAEIAALKVDLKSTEKLCADVLQQNNERVNVVEIRQTPEADKSCPELLIEIRDLLKGGK